MGDVRQKTCAACGQPFECCAGGCWCDAVALDAAARAALRERYADCLCPACLESAALAKNSSDPRRMR